jgi:hypothetical protein
MTVSVTTTLISYSGNGTLTIFPYNFRIFADTDLEVTLISALGQATVQQLGVDYTVSGVGVQAGGNVTMATAPASGTVLRIERILPVLQETAYTEGDNFPAAAHEEALDRQTMISQQLSAKMDRLPILPETFLGTGTVFPTNATGSPAYIRWNAAGTALECDPGLPVTTPTLSLIIVNAYGDGVTLDDVALAAAIAANPSGGVLYFGAPCAIDLPVVIPDTFTIADGPYQIFSCTGSGAVTLPATTTAYPQWWGANVTASLNAALASGASVVDLGNHTYVVATTVLWDISKCDLRGNGAKFDATGNSGIAVQARNGSATTNVFYPWSKRRSGGFEIEGDRVTYVSCVGLEINGSYEISGFRLYNVVAHGFNIALNLDLPSHIYASSFRDCAFYDSVYAFKATHGGETVTFEKSLFFNSTYGFYASDGGHWVLNDCHVNYNNQAVYAAGSARVTLNNPFIESNLDTDYWIKCTGASTAIILNNGVIVNPCASAKTYEVGLADQCGAEGIVIDGTLMSGFTAANYGVTDLIKVTDYTGAVQFKGIRPFIASDGVRTVATDGLMLSSHLNYLADGGFETAYTTDWTASSGAGYTAPALDAVEFHGGAKSLKFAPTVGNQTQIIRSIPCRVGEWGRMSFWLKQDLSTSTDTFRIEAGYLSADGSEIPYHSNVIDLSQAGTHYDDWTHLWITPYYPAPAGAVSAYFKFKVGTAASDGNGETYVDDVQINMWIQ